MWKGKKLKVRGDAKAAALLFEKALEVDPQFAMAMQSLSSAHQNLGHRKETLKYRKLAVENAVRLPARDRYFIEGSYYVLTEETRGRGLQILEKLLELYPDHRTGRNNLAYYYLGFERFGEATRHFEELNRRGGAGLWGYSNLARCYTLQGEFDKGYEVINSYVARYPENSTGYRELGHHLTRWGRLDEAVESFRTAESLAPGDLALQNGRWNVFILRGEWEGLFWEALALAKPGRVEDAEATAKKLRQRTESLPTDKEKRRHLHLVGELALARGDSQSAIEKLEKAQSMLPARGLFGGENRRNTHVPIWFSLARAYLEAGDETKADQWFRRVTESTTEHIWWPIPYVRSFYFLGKIS